MKNNNMIECFLLSIFLCFYSFSFANDAVLKGGFAKIDITPHKPVTLSGYADRTELSSGVHDSLSARISVFQYGERRIVIISADIIGFYDNAGEGIRQALLNELKLRPEELMLSAVHTHAGPRIVLDKAGGHPNNIEYTLSLQQKLISAAEKALSDLQPISIGICKGSSPVGVNRREIYYDNAGNPRVWIGRNPNGIQDKEVTVLKMAAENGKTAGLLWEYATHSTALGWENYLISGDVHGLAEQFIERYLGNGIMAAGFAGASGDIDPWYRVLPGFETTNGWVPEPILLGTMLGEEVLHVLRKIELTSSLGPVNSLFETMQLPGKPSGDIKTTIDHEAVPLNITVACVGEIAFVGIGAEVLSEIGLAIKAGSPFKNTMIITHCNGEADYIPPQHLYIEGGYEVMSSPFASTAADLLVKRVIRLLHRL